MMVMMMVLIMKRTIRETLNTNDQKAEQTLFNKHSSLHFSKPTFNAGAALSVTREITPRLTQPIHRQVEKLSPCSANDRLNSE